MEIRDVIFAGGVLTHKHSKEGRKKGTKVGKKEGILLILQAHELKLLLLKIFNHRNRNFNLGRNF